MILDTNALSALAEGSRDLETAAAEVDVFFLPVIVLGEFRFGALRSRHRKKYLSWLGELVDASVVLSVDAETSVRYGNLRHELREAGRPIPSNDTWIAALALQHGLPVLSRDAHFDQVAGLRRVPF